MSMLRQLVGGYYRDVKKMFFASKIKKKLVDYKTGIWQTDEMANAFIKGSDADNVVAASLMDREVNEYFLSECVKGDKVLDIGCGHGIVSEFLAEHGMNVTAVDISEKLLDNLKERIAGRNLSIDIKRGDAYNIPCENEHFDVVVARMFLPHFPDWPKVLKEMVRVTRKDGKLLVHFNSRENTALGQKTAIKDCKFPVSEDISNPFTFSAEADGAELASVAGKLGLQVVSRVPMSFFINNKLIGYQLGTEGNAKYMDQLQGYLKDKKVEEFVLWFDKEVIAKCSPAFSAANVISFKKN